MEMSVYDAFVILTGANVIAFAACIKLLGKKNGPTLATAISIVFAGAMFMFVGIR